MPIKSRCMCVVAAALSIASSSCVARIVPTDVSELEIGTSPDRLNKILEREPSETQELKENVQVYYYRIDRGYSPGLANGLSWPGTNKNKLELANDSIWPDINFIAPALYLASFGIVSVVSEVDVEAHRSEQIGLLQVYFEDNRLSWSGRFNPDTSDPGAGRQRMAKVAEAYGRLSNEETRGEAAYELAVNAFPATIRNYWWCKSANFGYALGQNAVERYELNCSP